MTVNGQVYNYPETDDVDWGPEATDWAQAVTVGMLQKAGGLFQLLAEVDFGTSYGVKSLYYKSRTSNIADSGQIRLARADVISFRNQANSANLDLGVSASDQLQFNGVDVQSSISVSDTTTIDLTLVGTTLSADINAGSITNSEISNSAAIAFSKLADLTSGNILVGDGSNVATSVSLSGDATLSNTGALTIANDAVTNAKLAEMATLTIKGNSTGGTANPTDLSVTAVTAMLNVFVGDSGSGGTKGLVPAPAAGDAASNKFLSAGGTWSVPTGAGDVTGPGSSTDNGFVRFNGTTGKVIKDSPATIVNADVDASAAIAYSKLNLSGSIVNADISASAAIAFSKLASLSSANILVGNGSNVAAAVAVTGDISLSNAGVTAYSGIVPLNKGGTNKNMTASAGSVAYSDSDSLELTSVGNVNEYLASMGSSGPIWQTYIPPFIRTYTSGSSATHTLGYAFVISSGSATAGATYTNNGNTYTVLATVSSATLIYLSGSANPTSSGTLAKSAGTGDSTLTFSYYRKPSYSNVKMVGGGGGGSGGGPSGASSGSDGNDTTFGTSLLTAAKGIKGTWNGVGGAGGAATINSPAYGIGITGGSGGGFDASNGSGGAQHGSAGGNSALFGGAGQSSVYNNTGQTATANTGGGGQGGGNGNAASSDGGSGGGAGASIDAIIPNPSNTYTYTVGAGGSGGAGGGGGFGGGAGADGRIVVIEHFQ